MAEQIRRARPGTAAIRAAAALCATAIPPLALAEQQPAELGGSLLQVALGLGAVILLLLAALYALKRLSAPRGAASGLMRVIAATAVGTRERVVLMEVGETWLVLGVAPGQVRSLHVLPRLADVPSSSGTSAAGGQDFASWLERVRNRGSHAR